MFVISSFLVLAFSNTRTRKFKGGWFYLSKHWRKGNTHCLFNNQKNCLKLGPKKMKKWLVHVFHYLTYVPFSSELLLWQSRVVESYWKIPSKWILLCMIFKLFLFSYKKRFQAVFLVLDSLERHTRIDMSFSGTPYEFAWKMKHFLAFHLKSYIL